MRAGSLILFSVVAGAAAAYMIAKQLIPDTVSGVQSSITDALTGLLAKFEGYSAVPYQDSAGLWTIGFGHLIVSGDGFWSPSMPNGRQQITVEEARVLLDQDTAIAQRAVDHYVLVPINNNQRTALVSLAYNIGQSRFGSSTLVRLLNQGDYEGAAAQFAVWNKAGGQVSPGLVARRDEEARLFSA